MPRRTRLLVSRPWGTSAVHLRYAPGQPEQHPLVLACLTTFLRLHLSPRAVMCSRSRRQADPRQYSILPRVCLRSSDRAASVDSAPINLASFATTRLAHVT